MSGQASTEGDLGQDLPVAVAEPELLGAPEVEMPPPVEEPQVSAGVATVDESSPVEAEAAQASELVAAEGLPAEETEAAVEKSVEAEVAQATEVIAAEASPVAAEELAAEETAGALEEPSEADVAITVPPGRRERKKALERASVLEAPVSAALPTLPDVERYKALLLQKPKDEETRLALARAYRDQAEVKMALDQYGLLVKAKPKLLQEAISDMESIVASRPDNLAAHELLADLYAKGGQLQKALDRYRWIVQRLEDKSA